MVILFTLFAGVSAGFLMASLFVVSKTADLESENADLRAALDSSERRALDEW
jgi:MFS superfamily sulfate permease-like transporter